MKTSSVFNFVLAAQLVFCSSSQADSITSTEAKDYIGVTATVCGVVASANHAIRSTGKPIFLNLDEAFPNHVFTAVIFEDYQQNFSYDLTRLKGKYICVSGRVDEYKGLPQIKVRTQNQIKAN